MTATLAPFPPARGLRAAALDALAASLRAGLSAAAVVRRDEPLSKRTTLRVGGPADVYVEPESEADLAFTLRAARAADEPVFLLGRGSNLLVRDGGLRAVVVSLARPAFAAVRVEAPRLHAGAGARLKHLAVEARRAGLAGLEFFEGIPGSLGGALRMNAGAMGRWTFDVVESLRFMDAEGGVHERLAAEVRAEYRACPLLRDHVALSAVLRGEPALPAEIAARMAQYSAKRWESQPPQPSAGCIFKNPAAAPAGKLVDELGLKGTRHGGAAVSTVHGNFIVNDGGAAAADVLRLIETVRARVLAERGIRLETEVEIVGEEVPSRA
ncbi:MAG: UDP-N-acetylmuramate dehydrogenase [Limisphaerales bacterium]